MLKPLPSCSQLLPGGLVVWTTVTEHIQIVPSSDTASSFNCSTRMAPLPSRPCHAEQASLLHAEAVPTRILDQMHACGLTREHVASHLQVSLAAAALLLGPLQATLLGAGALRVLMRKGRPAHAPVQMRGWHGMSCYSDLLPACWAHVVHPFRDVRLQPCSCKA